jgi:predicted CoA-binding protein
MKIEKNNFVVTFKTEKEVSDYIGMHIPEERRLLWLGFFIANNYIAQKLEDDGIELVKKK